MKKAGGILILSLIVILSGNMNRASAIENTDNSYEISGQACGISDNRLCLGEDLAKELLKQAIYAAGTKILNKYINSGVPVQAVPTAVVAPTVYTPPVSIVTPDSSTFVPAYIPTAVDSTNSGMTISQ